MPSASSDPAHRSNRPTDFVSRRRWHRLRAWAATAAFSALAALADIGRPRLGATTLEEAGASLQQVSVPPVPSPRNAAPIVGFVDAHNHQFAYLAFGGRAVVGRAYGPMSSALSADIDRAHHGRDHWGDIINGFVTTRGPGILLYSNSGYPDFSGWPNAFEWDHQKVHQEWLYRALRGGMHLMVMFAVDGPPLCDKVDTDLRHCWDEMATIDRQLDAAYAMQRYIDAASGGPGRGWYRIVTTPAEARRVIAEGKLAVVLGIETAHLFNCNGEPCEWKTQLDHYWARGVRHFYPIHQDDNVFGGASYFQPDLQRQENWFADRFKVTPAYTQYTRPCDQYDLGRCNVKGLTAAGVRFLTELMHLGGIIDADHMSDRSFADTMALARRYGCYPVAATHAGFNRINNDGQDHEGQLTAQELRQIVDCGGLVSLITGQGNIGDVDTWTRPNGTRINHACGRSTETLVQAYLYAIDNAPGAAFGLGSDVNTPLDQPGPRFGPGQCLTVTGHTGSNRNWALAKSEARLRYPFVARGSGERLDRSQSGTRTFDFNVDGLAQLGLLPDMVADFEVLGVRAEDMKPLLSSAEGYVQMWERADRLKEQIPSGFNPSRRTRFGRITTTDRADVVSWHAEANVVPASVVEFTFCQSQPLSWRKTMGLLNGIGRSVPLSVVDDRKCASGRLTPEETRNGQSFALEKAKAWGIMTNVGEFPVSTFGPLEGGTRVTVTWNRD